MRQKLLDRDFERETVEDVMREIIEKKYLREDLYIEARIKGFILKGFNPSAISYKLSQEKCYVSQEDIMAIYEQVESNPDDQLFELILKKVRIDYDFVSDKEKLRQKTLRYVASRGHSLSEASRLYPRALEKYLSDLH